MSLTSVSCIDTGSRGRVLSSLPLATLRLFLLLSFLVPTPKVQSCKGGTVTAFGVGCVEMFLILFPKVVAFHMRLTILEVEEPGFQRTLSRTIWVALSLEKRVHGSFVILSMFSSLYLRAEMEAWPETGAEAPTLLGSGAPALLASLSGLLWHTEPGGVFLRAREPVAISSTMSWSCISSYDITLCSLFFLPYFVGPEENLMRGGKRV